MKSKLFHLSLLLVGQCSLLFIVYVMFDNRDKISQPQSVIIKPTELGLQRILSMLTSAAAVEPIIAVNTSCSLSPPSPTPPPCSGHTALSGALLDSPRRIVLMIMFGFEVDTLEIALKQQQDLVDKIFILESSFTHRGVSSTTEYNDTLYKQDNKIK